MDTQSTAEIHSLFPTPVVKFSLGREFSQEELNFALQSSLHKNTGNLISDDYYVLKNRKLNKLRKFIDTCLASYVDGIYSPKDSFKLSVTQSWFNVTEPGQFHHKHNHPNSMVSGVLYIKTDQERDKIYFYNPSVYSPFDVPAQTYNLFNSKSWWLSVKTGDLLMFPSYLTHSVEMINEGEPRVSMAFNTFVCGTLGSVREATALTVKELS